MTAQLPQFTLRDLLDAGVHFGHRTHRWNPKMRHLIFGQRNGIHILDLRQTVPALYQALACLQKNAASGGRVLFVGSKKQAQDIVVETAGRTGQYYVNHRWLGGMLTNWKTISNSIKRMKQLEEMVITNDTNKYTKKELLDAQRESVKLKTVLGGIQSMPGLPDVVVVVDTNRENIAIEEASKLGIPVIAMLDSNSNPDGIQYGFAGNDDSTRSLRLYFKLFAEAILAGAATRPASSKAEVEAKDQAIQASRKTVVKLSAKASKAAEKEDAPEVTTVVAVTKKQATKAKAVAAAAAE